MSARPYDCSLAAAKNRPSGSRLRGLTVGLATLTGLFGSLSAEAGFRPFSFTFDTKTLSRGDVELEQWMWGKVDAPPAGASPAWIWFAPVYGVTQRLEVALP